MRACSAHVQKNKKNPPPALVWEGGASGCILPFVFPRRLGASGKVGIFFQGAGGGILGMNRQDAKDALVEGEEGVEGLGGLAKAGC